MPRRKKTEVVVAEAAREPELQAAPCEPAPDHPGPETESVMRTKTGSRARTADGPRPGSKLAKIATMLKRPSGCTAAEVMKACDWPSVSMPQQAKAAGIRLKKEKVDGVTRYRAA